MTTQNVKQIIQEWFRANLNLYSNHYPIENGEVTQEAINVAERVALSYYREKSHVENLRDQLSNITLQNYIDWCLEELAIWANEQTENK